jgi:hypothetical protein
MTHKFYGNHPVEFVANLSSCSFQVTVIDKQIELVGFFFSFNSDSFDIECFSLLYIIAGSMMCCRKSLTLVFQKLSVKDPELPV